jgi:hypothetical protein
MRNPASQSLATLLVALFLTTLCYAATLMTELVRIQDVSHTKVITVQKLQGRTNCLTLEISQGKTSLRRLDFFERQEVNTLTDRLNLLAGQPYPHSRTDPDPNARWVLEPYSRGGVELSLGGAKDFVSVKLDAKAAKTLSSSLTGSLTVLKD